MTPKQYLSILVKDRKDIEKRIKKLEKLRQQIPSNCILKYTNFGDETSREFAFNKYEIQSMIKALLGDKKFEKHSKCLAIDKAKEETRPSRH